MAKQYNYRCPCGGEFNVPATPKFNMGAVQQVPRCPFCGKPMSGLA